MTILTFINFSAHSWKGVSFAMENEWNEKADVFVEFTCRAFVQGRLTEEAIEQIVKGSKRVAMEQSTRISKRMENSIASQFRLMMGRQK